MKRAFILITILLSITSLTASAQTFSISGSVKNVNGNGLAGATVVVNNTRYSMACDTAGNFILKDVQPGNYTITISAIGYKETNRSVKVTSDVVMHIILASADRQLKDVTIQAGSGNGFGITRLRSVEGTAINAGKKSEVIVLDDIVANKGANTTRQIYGKISGLNIWENDGAGIQLGIGGRGLNPNRVTNFNTRQNGYDISADALGYPESYYTPAAELTDRIEILRGASSLQYGTQFGGIINFKLKEGPADKPFELTSRTTAGSWGFLNFTNSVGGTVDKVKYYALYQHKQGDGWRPNSNFNVNTAYAGVTYSFNTQLAVTVQYTFMDYLAHQPGGLTDDEFKTDPHQSIRARNWFKVNWNLGAVILDYKIADNLKFNSRFFVLSAARDAVGNLEYINHSDIGGDRNLFVDQYTNYGNESRLLYTYKLGSNPQNLLVGLRYYKGHTDRQQGLGSNGSDADFTYGSSSADTNAYSHYVFPNYNVAFFAENIFRITPKFSIIPGVRFENIITRANGSFVLVNTDMAGNVIFRKDSVDNKNSTRHFVIGGIGLSYYQNEAMQFYGNVSQNYRAINFNDLNSSVKGLQVDPNLKDETGYSADIGMRGNITDVFNYDVSLFAIHYDNRIGSVESSDASYNTFRYRTNIGQSISWGMESFAELELLHLVNKDPSDTRLSVFSNLALIDASYTTTKNHAYDNNKVEFAPDVIFKTGLTYRHKKLSATYQAAYTSEQFGDATNAKIAAPNAIVGIIPTYTVMDLSASYKLSRLFTLEGSINNLADARYFTRRAESYPGPGIIPADARSYFLTLQFKL
ncbi:TonB-dependent receptor domain-containing protein [Mucilaginibacter sp. AW1-3]